MNIARERVAMDRAAVEHFIEVLPESCCLCAELREATILCLEDEREWVCVAGLALFASMDTDGLAKMIDKRRVSDELQQC
jgi:hypothetical protein